MADRVHRERRVLVGEDPDQAAPDEHLEPELPAAAPDGVPDGEGQCEGQHDPEEVHPVDAPDQQVVVEILPVVVASFHPFEVEQPAHVRVEEPPQGSPGIRGEAGMWRVRVAFLVGERVMLAVVGHPLGHGSLDRHRAENCERCAYRFRGLEAAVGEQPVEANRRSEARQHVQDPEDSHVDPREGDAPQADRRGDEPERRDHDREQRHDLTRARRVLAHGRDRDITADELEALRHDLSSNGRVSDESPLR